MPAKSRPRKAKGNVAVGLLAEHVTHGHSRERLSDFVEVTERVSTVSWDDAAKRAVETAAKSLRDLRIAEVIKMDLKVDDGKVVAYRTKLALSFKYEE